MKEKYIFYLLRKSFQSSYLLYKFFSHRQFLLRIIMGPTCSICQRQSVPGSLSSDSLSSPPPTFHWFQTTYSKSIILWITTQVIRSNWKVFWIFTFSFHFFPLTHIFVQFWTFLWILNNPFRSSNNKSPPFLHFQMIHAMYIVDCLLVLNHSVSVSLIIPSLDSITYISVHLFSINETLKEWNFRNVILITMPLTSWKLAW